MIYIASPYSDPDKEVVKFRTSVVCKYSAKLLKKKMSCVSPITMGTGIFQHATLPSDFEFWQHLSYDLLSICSELYVLKLAGWEESIGVQGEIEFAKKKNIPIHYIDIYYLLSIGEL